MLSPAGSDMSLSDDEDIHINACAETNANDGSVGSIPDDPVVSVLSLDMARIMRSYAQDISNGVTRVHGCICVVPFSKTYVWLV